MVSKYPNSSVRFETHSLTPKQYKQYYLDINYYRTVEGPWLNKQIKKTLTVPDDIFHQEYLGIILI